MTGDATINYVDLGFTSARQFWIEVALPAYERFMMAPSGRTAIEAATHAWHIHEWLWHELPGPKTNSELVGYCNRITSECPELAWVRDIAEAGKHRRLKRPSVAVTRAAQMPNPVTFNGEPLTFNGEPITLGTILKIELKDMSVHDVEDVLAKTVMFWEGKFASSPI